MPLFKYCVMIFKACSVSKELGDKAMVHLASSTIIEKKFRNIVSTLSGTG
jgi:hypothetical protein